MAYKVKVIKNPIAVPSCCLYVEEDQVLASRKRMQEGASSLILPSTVLFYFGRILAEKMERSLTTDRNHKESVEFFDLQRQRGGKIQLIV
jgi:hypothetical protein